MRKNLFARLLVVVVILGLWLTPLSATPVRAAAAWQYVALGDSIAVGLWGRPGYVWRYKNHIEQDNPVTVSINNLAHNGWTSADLLNAVRTDPAFRTALAAADVITWDIGGNDFIGARNQYKDKTCGGADNQDCLRDGVAAFKANWEAIVLEVLGLRKPGSIIRTMDLYNPYVKADKLADTWPGDAGTDFQVFKPYVDDVNNFIGANSASHSLLYAQVYLAFNGACGCEEAASKGYLSFDRLHPSPAGHQKIADLLDALGYAPTP